MFTLSAVVLNLFYLAAHLAIKIFGATPNGKIEQK